MAAGSDNCHCGKLLDVNGNVLGEPEVGEEESGSDPKSRTKPVTANDKDEDGKDNKIVGGMATGEFEIPWQVRSTITIAWFTRFLFNMF